MQPSSPTDPSSSEPASGPVTLEIGQLDRKYGELRLAEPGRQSRLTAAILAHGQQIPVLVVRVETVCTDRYVLIDGYARVSALLALARDLVDALVLSGTETHALVLSYRLEAGRRRSALEEAWLLRELISQGESPAALAVSLHRSTSWISRRLALVRVLPDSVQESLRRGQIPAQAAMKSLVPLARANRGQCEQLVRQLQGEPISVRQMETLYQGWIAGDPEQRARLLEHPWLFLKAKEEISPEPTPIPEPAEGAQLEKLVESLLGMACQARRWIRRGAWHEANRPQRRAIRARWRELARVLSELEELTEEETGDARSRHAQRDPAPEEARTRDPGHRADLAGVEELRQTSSPERERGGSPAGTRREVDAAPGSGACAAPAV